VTSDCALDFRALLPAASAVSVETGWVSTDPRPSWASAPPGTLPAQRGNAFASPPPSAFTVKNPSRLALGVSPLRGLACLESGCRPARAFRPEPPSLLSKSRVRGLVPDGPPSRRTRRSLEHASCHRLLAVTARNHRLTESRQRARSGHVPVRCLGIFGGSLWSCCEQGVRVCPEGAVDCAGNGRSPSFWTRRTGSHQAFIVRSATVRSGRPLAGRQGCAAACRARDRSTPSR